MKQNRFFLNRNAQQEGELWTFTKRNGEAYARKSVPETSEQAAESVRGEKATHHERVVLSLLKQYPNGLTNHEIADKTGFAWNTCTPRIRPLVRKGLVVDSGERREGCTNRKCVVWKAT